MCIREESRRIRLNLRHLEAHPGVCSRSCGVDTRGEGTSQTSDRPTKFIIPNRVWERDARRAGCATGALVNVCCGLCWGFVFADDIDEGDVLIIS